MMRLRGSWTKLERCDHDEAHGYDGRPARLPTPSRRRAKELLALLASASRSLVGTAQQRSDWEVVSVSFRAPLLTVHVCIHVRTLKLALLKTQ
jgi:hypothetical protein